VQTENIPQHNPFSHVATISERNGSDFDLGSFRGSLFDNSERGRFEYHQRARRLNTIRTTSNMANTENQSLNPRDFTFRPSDLSDESINNSPDTHIARSGSRNRDGIVKPNISVYGPQDEALMKSADHSIEESINPNQLDSPVSHSMSKAKTVSFQITELDGKEDSPEPNDHLEAESTELQTKVSESSTTAAKMGRLGHK
jgi:hypothetical protein